MKNASTVKVKKIYVKNIKAVSEFELDLNGATVVLTGGNNKGKSTILSSTINRIRGDKSDLIVKDNEENGVGLIELTDGSKFVWDINKSGDDRLSYITSNNEKINATKDIREKYFPPVFSIDKFLSQTPKEQLKTITKVTGIDLEIVEAQYKEAFEFRTIRGRIRDEEKAKVGEIDYGLPESIYPADELLSEIATIDSHNEKYNDKIKQIDDDEKLLEEMRAKAMEIKNRIKENKERTDSNRIKDNKDILTAKLNKLRSDNDLITENNKRVDQNQRAQEAIKEWEAANEIVKEMDQKRKDILNSANLPKEFSIDNGSLLFRGLPIDRQSQSSSALYIAGLKLAKELLGEVECLHFDASFLDNKSLHDVWQWANEEGLQLMIERPDMEGGDIEYKFLES